MMQIVLALQRSFGSLVQVRIWFYILAPAMIAILCMIGLSVALLEQLISGFVEQPPMSWLAGWGAVWLAHALAALGGWMLILSVCYLIAMLLTAILVLPLMLDFIAQSDYPELAKLGRDNPLVSTWFSIWSAILFVIGWLLTLPLWLIPGVGLFLPLFWMAWLSRRTFGYDVLIGHATPDEWREINRQQAMPMLMLGFVMAALTHVPFVGLLAPSLAALAYIHFCLEALRRLRQGAVVAVIDRSVQQTGR